MTNFALRKAPIRGLHKILKKKTWQIPLLDTIIDGLHATSIADLLILIRHPFFRNGIPFAILIGGVFHAPGLYQTGDWKRFFKKLGISVVRAAAAWGGGAIARCWAGICNWGTSRMANRAPFSYCRLFSRCQIWNAGSIQVHHFEFPRQFWIFWVVGQKLRCSFLL